MREDLVRIQFQVGHEIPTAQPSGDAMTLPVQSNVKNKLLTMLPADDFRQIAPELTYVDLRRGTVLASVGDPIEHVYFLASGIGSLVTTTPSGLQAESGIFGYDGYLPTTAMADVELSSHDISVQLPGGAYQMTYNSFRKWMDTNRSFSKVVLRSIEAFSIQLAHTAVSNAVHDVDQRLARWLLMCHDRVSGNEIAITHLFISRMLAVRRPSVTTSLQTLEGNGFIKSERSLITIRNRPALQEFASDAYGRPEREYQRLMSDLF